MTLSSLSDAITRSQNVAAEVTAAVYRVGAVLGIEMPPHPNHFDAPEGPEVGPQRASVVDAAAREIEANSDSLMATMRAAEHIAQVLLDGVPDKPQPYRARTATAVTDRGYASPEEAPQEAVRRSIFPGRTHTTVEDTPDARDHRGY